MQVEPQPDSLMLQMTCTIRPVTYDDLPALEMDGQFTKFRNLFRRAFREMQQGRRLLLVLECNRTIIGRLFVLFRSSDHSIADGRRRAYLYSFFIQPAFRGMGLGTRMVQYAEHILIERSFEYVTIAVAKENLGAQKLYQRLNYQISRDDEGHWSYTDHKGRIHRMSEPCYILEKELRNTF